MRVPVSVSLSDRGGDDWRDSAACRDMDPHDFDDGGTETAWHACKNTCQVAEECRADCFRELPRGVYRAGRYWPEKSIVEAHAEVLDLKRRTS